MFEQRFLKKYITAASVLLLVFLCGFFYYEQVAEFIDFLGDREKINAFVLSYGQSAPLAFILLQIFQVVFAPVPGEAAGFIGGYLFGTLPGFIYSTIGLSVGSSINLLVGRVLGKRFVRKLVPRDRFEKIDALVSRQGLMVIFLLFILPGFPKDYLCLFLGMSGLPISWLFLSATVGRMPGTFILSFQGASVFNEMYGVVVTVLITCVVLGAFFMKYKKAIRKWIKSRRNRT